MLANLQHKTQSFINDNASIILTAGGVVGTVTTAALTGRASVKAHVILEKAEEERLREFRSSEGEGATYEPMPKMQKVVLVGPQFIPPVVTGSATIAAIVFAHRMSASKAAALAAAYGMSQKQLDEYKTKIEEKLTGKKASEIRDEVQQDRVNERPASKEVIIIGNGEVLFYDSYSCRYFKSTMERVRQAEHEVTQEILKTNECSLDTFYEALGVPGTQFSNEVGWNLQHSLTVDYSTVMSDTDEPCIAIEFRNMPMFQYGVSY